MATDHQVSCSNHWEFALLYSGNYVGFSIIYEYYFIVTLRRKLRDDLLRMTVCFTRWKKQDPAVGLFKYKEYTDWASQSFAAHHALHAFPLKHLYQELGASVAGLSLTSTPSHHHNTNNSSALQLGASLRRTAPRLQVIQKQLEKRFTAAGGAGSASQRGGFHSAAKQASAVGSRMVLSTRGSRALSPPLGGARSPSAAAVAAAAASRNHLTSNAADHSNAAAMGDIFATPSRFATPAHHSRPPLSANANLSILQSRGVDLNVHELM